MKTVKTDSFTLEVEDNAVVLCVVRKPNDVGSEGGVIVSGDFEELLITLSILGGAAAKVLTNEHEVSNKEAAGLVVKAVAVGVDEMYKDIDDLLIKQEVQ